MTRPVLTPDLPAAEFRRYYWLNQELLGFCRANALSTHGSKAELTDRIAVWLATGTRTAPVARRPPARHLPATLTRDTLITPGWRCTQALRAFFCAEIGAHFHFDQRMRDLIAQGAGTTLGEAILAWQQPRQATTIAPQFEYNRHLRAYHHTHPNATRAEAIQAWNELKAQRRTLDDNA